MWLQLQNRPRVIQYCQIRRKIVAHKTHNLRFLEWISLKLRVSLIGSKWECYLGASRTPVTSSVKSTLRTTAINNLAGHLACAAVVVRISVLVDRRHCRIYFSCFVWMCFEEQKMSPIAALYVRFIEFPHYFWKLCSRECMNWRSTWWCFFSVIGERVLRI